MAAASHRRPMLLKRRPGPAPSRRDQSLFRTAGKLQRAPRHRLDFRACAPIAQLHRTAEQLQLEQLLQRRRHPVGHRGSVLLRAQVGGRKVCRRRRKIFGTFAVTTGIAGQRRRQVARSKHLAVSQVEHTNAQRGDQQFFPTQGSSGLRHVAPGLLGLGLDQKKRITGT